ncbi:MAG TPA: hypothetical protein VGJ21_16620 [Terracidiphilus sp.]|jgi:hypothetical protein
MTQLQEIVRDFAAAFKAVDASGPRGRSKSREYEPGIGPLTENEAVRLATEWLKRMKPDTYASGGPKPYPNSRQLCDLLIPGEWAIEFKLIRPFGDNGVEAEHWSENILHPYPGNVSAIGDALKLADSSFKERKAIIVYGFEHLPAKIDLNVSTTCFELICREVVRIKLSVRVSADFSELMHRYHQHGRIFGWEVIARHDS